MTQVLKIIITLNFNKFFRVFIITLASDRVMKTVMEI